MKLENRTYSSGVSRFVTLFILLASLLVLPKAQATIDDTFTISQLRYMVLTEEPASKTGTVSVEPKSKKISGNISIPASVANWGINYSVTLIPKKAFAECHALASIVIPDSVTAIHTDAFDGCRSLTSVAMGNSVTSIGHYAFYECSKLTSIVIPDSITEIGVGAFERCRSLTSVVMGDGLTYINNHVFSECSKLTSIVIPDSVTTIYDGAFEGCSSLTDFVIPDNVMKIGPRAFNECDNLPPILFNKEKKILVCRVYIKSGKNWIHQKWKNSEGFRREEDGGERGMRRFIG